MKVKSLEWDSHFFKKKIGEIFIAEEKITVIDECSYDLIYVKSTKEISLKINGFLRDYSETKVIFSQDGLKPLQLMDECVVSVFDTNIKKEDLYKLAFESGKFSRFKLDKNFEQDTFKKLYKQWIDNSFKKILADAILVFKEKEKVLGFVTYKIFGDYATVGLIAVEPESQGQQIGARLINAVEVNILNIGIKELRIPTQLSNTQACSFYKKLGFKVKEFLFIKHYWKL